MSAVSYREPFVVIPAWLISRVQPSSLVVYAALATFAGADGECWPKQTTIAGKAGLSVETVKRGLRELREVGAITVEERYRDDGGQSTNAYVLENGSPATPEAVTDDRRGAGHTRPTELEPGIELEQTINPPLAPPTHKVDRRPVTAEEEEAAEDILRTWNQETGQALTAWEWKAKMIRRLREHPDLTLAAHGHVIRANLANPWWSGPATPSVVYGSAAQFERSVLAAREHAGAGGVATFDVAMAAITEARRDARG